MQFEYWCTWRGKKMNGRKKRKIMIGRKKMKNNDWREKNEKNYIGRKEKNEKNDWQE
jgi:hypothetical protein